LSSPLAGLFFSHQPVDPEIDQYLYKIPVFKGIGGKAKKMGSAGTIG